MFFENIKNFYFIFFLLFLSCGQDFSKEDKESIIYIKVPVNINLFDKKNNHFKLFDPSDYRIDIEGCSSSYSQRGINPQNDSINLRQGDQDCIAILSSFVMDGVSYNAPTSALGSEALNNDIWKNDKTVTFQGDDTTSEALVTVETQLSTISESSSISFSIRSIKKGNKIIYDEVCFADNHTKLSNCITNSVDNTLIVIEGTITTSSTLVIDDKTTFMGWDNTTSIIDGASSHRIFTISENTEVNIIDLSFQNGDDSADVTGAIFFSSGSSGSVKNCDFSIGNENPAIYFDADSKDNIDALCENNFTGTTVGCSSVSCITNEVSCR